MRVEVLSGTTALRRWFGSAQGGGRVRPGARHVCFGRARQQARRRSRGRRAGPRLVALPDRFPWVRDIEP